MCDCLVRLSTSFSGGGKAVTGTQHPRDDVCSKMFPLQCNEQKSLHPKAVGKSLPCAQPAVHGWGARVSLGAQRGVGTPSHGQGVQEAQGGAAAELSLHSGVLGVGLQPLCALCGWQGGFGLRGVRMALSRQSSACPGLLVVIIP